MIHRTMPILLATLILASCATPAANRRLNDQYVLWKSRVRYEQCMMSAEANLRGPNLRKNGYLRNPDDYSIAQLSNPSLIDAADAASLSAYENALPSCRDIMLRAYGLVDGQLAVVAEQATVAEDRNAASLLQRKESWGQFAATRQQNQLAATRGTASAVDALNKELDQENNAELSTGAYRFPKFFD